MDRAPGRADPQGRLRLRRPALRPLQVRRHDHQHRHLSADPGPLRPPHPPADRWRFRRLGRPGPALPRARRLDRRHQQVRHRHLDDDVGAGRRVRRLPDAARGEDPRPEGPRRRPRADVPPGRRDDPAAGRRRTRTSGSTIRGSHEVPAYGFERIIDPPPLEVNTIRLLSEFHSGSLTMGGTWESMIAPDNARDGARAGRRGGPARRLTRGRSSGSAGTWPRPGRRPPRWPSRSRRSTSPTTCGRGSSTTSS